MKTQNDNIRTYASKADYLKRSPVVKGNTLKEATKAVAPAEKVAIEESSKTIQSPKEAVKDASDRVKDKIKEGGDAGKHLLSQAGSAILRSVAGGAIPGVSLPSFPGADVGVQKTNSLEGVKAEMATIDKPGIFFIRGFELNPFSSDETGLPGMAKNIPSAESFSWNDEDGVIEAIKKRPVNQPIILVGHGLGGDTAVSITNRLNNIENNFRSVDLLVTLDSVGTDNDIIPQNVKENFNLISDQDFLFNDGPNIARKKDATKVINELLSANHDELATDPEVQFMVYDKINQTLMNAVARNNLRNLLNQEAMRIHNLHGQAARVISS